MIELIKNKNNDSLPHIVRTGDLMAFRPEELKLGKSVDFIWADPPWGDRMMKFFFTQNLKFEPSRREVLWPYQEFMKGLLERCVPLMGQKTIMFIEYGKANTEAITNIMTESPLNIIGKRDINYFGNGKWLSHDLYILALHNDQTINNFVPSSEELKGIGGSKMIVKTIKNLLSSHYVESCPNNEKTIFDPTCGIGLTAEASLHYGMRFIGNEFILERAERTKQKLKKAVK